MPTPPPGTRSGPVRSRAAAAARASAEASSRKASGRSAARTDASPVRPSPPAKSTTSKGLSATASPRPLGDGASASPQPLPAGLPEEQRALLLSLRDELASYTEHPLLPRGTIATAKRVFETYVVEQWAAGLGKAGTSLLPEYMEQVFADLGVQLTPNDVRDLLFGLGQSPEIAFHNAKVAATAATTQAMGDMSGEVGISVTPAGAGPLDRTVGPETTATDANASGAGASAQIEASVTNTAHSTARLQATGTPTARSSAPTATSAAATAALKAQGSGAVAVPFGLFLELLATTLGDCSYREEMGALWHHLDADNDDELSAADLRAALQQLQHLGSELGAPPAHLTSLLLGDERLRDLVAELDVDDDGVVSKKDFLASVNAN